MQIYNKEATDQYSDWSIADEIERQPILFCINSPAIEEPKKMPRNFRLRNGMIVKQSFARPCEYILSDGQILSLSYRDLNNPLTHTGGLYGPEYDVICEENNYHLTKENEMPVDPNNDYEATPGFETIDYWNGRIVKRMSDKDIFAAVSDLKKELVELEALPESIAVTKHIDRVNDGITKLMAAVDSRYTD